MRINNFYGRKWPQAASHTDSKDDSEDWGMVSSESISLYLHNSHFLTFPGFICEYLSVFT